MWVWVKVWWEGYRGGRGIRRLLLRVGRPRIGHRLLPAALAAPTLALDATNAYPRVGSASAPRPSHQRKCPLSHLSHSAQIPTHHRAHPHGYHPAST